MGLWDFISGTKRPADGVPVRSPQEVYNALLSVNRPTAPFVVRDGRPEHVDLVAEWRIVDAQWYGGLAKAGMKAKYQVRMRLHPQERQVRAVGLSISTTSSAGVFGFAKSAGFFRGRSFEFTLGQGYAFTEHGRFGEVYNYRFSTGELKRPLREMVTAGGWIWREVAFGRV